MLSKRLLASLGTALSAATLAVGALGVADASACDSRWSRGCGSYYAPPTGYSYGYAPSGYGMAYGFAPPAPIYGYGPFGPPPSAWYEPGYAGASYGSYGYGAGPYGYGYRNGRRGPRCDRGYGYGYGPHYGYRGYRPTGVWVPVR